MAINDVFEYVLVMDQDGQQLINRIHFLQNGPTTTPEIDLNTSFVANVTPAYLACCASNLNLVGSHVRRVYPTIGGTYKFDINASGTGTGNSLAPQSVAVLSFRGAVVNLLHRGRIHISGVPDPMTDDGVFKLAQMTLYVALSQTIVTAVGSFVAGNHNNLGGAFGRWIDARANTKVRTLRSRKMASL